LNGRFVAIELKVNAPIEKMQDFKLRSIADCGGYACVMSPLNFDIIYTHLTIIANAKTIKGEYI